MQNCTRASRRLDLNDAPTAICQRIQLVHSRPGNHKHVGKPAIDGHHRRCNIDLLHSVAKEAGLDPSNYFVRVENQATDRKNERTDIQDDKWARHFSPCHFFSCFGTHQTRAPALAFPSEGSWARCVTEICAKIPGLSSTHPCKGRVAPLTIGAAGFLPLVTVVLVLLGITDSTLRSMDESSRPPNTGTSADDGMTSR